MNINKTNNIITTQPYESKKQSTKKTSEQPYDMDTISISQESLVMMANEKANKLKPENSTEFQILSMNYKDAMEKLTEMFDNKLKEHSDIKSMIKLMYRKLDTDPSVNGRDKMDLKQQVMDLYVLVDTGVDISEGEPDDNGIENKLAVSVAKQMLRESLDTQDDMNQVIDALNDKRTNSAAKLYRKIMEGRISAIDKEKEEADKIKRRQLEEARREQEQFEAMYKQERMPEDVNIMKTKEEYKKIGNVFFEQSLFN